MDNEVLFSVSDGGVAFITLNRPKALNSLSYEMLKPIGEKLKEWQTNDQIHVIVLKGEGEKGFCAGGDIKTLYKARSSQEAFEKAEIFFEEEYKVDMAIYRFPKPIIACLDGIVMGGGVGLTYGASHRIITERTKWAMPEMNIGFFPDVGAAHFLNKAPGFIGRYLALTASVIQAPDVLFANAADSYMDSDKLSEFLARVEQTEWHGLDVNVILNQLLTAYASHPVKNGKLSALQNEIDKHFSKDTVEEILESLEKDPSEFASETKQLLLSKSPSSLKITLKQLTDGKEKTLEECFATDLLLAKKFLRHDDFFEGVRSVVIDKDRNPQYIYKTVVDFTDEDIKKFFQDSGVKVNK
ncbi:enoyl-CoA hydratase/isomerase family protein [Lysinibacillus sp. FJAT-14222]|uniref:enoyl-CoA hydratase/isomerase family protein n=1 Tax=Lysinibacillus sp. FJAT-14222 TaxID=1932366 RepID=UPI0006AE497E|nr:enoyl-CoA hydratase/isomerase family protein [Lysinibacillus sp. FJAT-14222]KOS60494.1 3-hydroxyisobutyryl-CoA hydrolase [Lysinibacillus sp. FJAT-14222]